MLVFKAVIPPTLLYGCETWALSADQTHKLDVVLHDCLRVVLGVRRGVDLISNAELRQRCCYQRDVATLTRKYRLRFLGHIARQQNTRFPKLLLFATHIPSVTARPRWGGEFLTGIYHDDLRAIGCYQNWFERAQARVLWRAMLEDKLG